MYGGNRICSFLIERAESGVRLRVDFCKRSSAVFQGRRKIVVDQASAWYSMYSWRHVDARARADVRVGGGALPAGRWKA